MNPKTFVVTGATGDTGRHTVKLLLERGYGVRALVHRADDRSERLKAQGADVLIGDLLDFDAVQAAVQGADAAYFVYPVLPGIVTATAYFALAAREAQVNTVVNMSQIVARRDAESGASQNHWVAERLFDLSGIGVTHLRPTIFAEWLLYSAEQIAASNTLALPFRDNKVALIAAEDQAAVIAAILENPDPHRGKTYPLFGAVEQTFPEIAAEMSQALGREIRYQPVEPEMFAGFLRAAGRDPFVIQHITEGMTPDFQSGIFAGNNEFVETIGGRKPLTITDFVARNAAAFGGNSR